MTPTAPKPIGRCASCGTPAHDVDALNFRCDACGDGVVASTADQDWRPCEPCLGTGKSLIWAKTADGSCPVCHGTGWITDAENVAALDEIDTVLAAIMVQFTPRWPPRPADCRKSRTGSFSILAHQTAKALTSEQEAELYDAVDDAREALEDRIRIAAADERAAIQVAGDGPATKSEAKTGDR